MGAHAVVADPPVVAAAPPPVSDDELIAATLAGDGSAFGELVRRYERAVFSLALRTLREREDAADAAQEAWVKAYRALASFRPGARFSTWIFTICYRCCCDRLSRRSRFSGSELPDRADPAPGPEQAAIDADIGVRLRRAIDALPEKYRVAITLFVLQGKRYEEIAEVLGLPLGTVKTHLHRAKDLLRRALAEPGDDR